jgi:hypothetical protein
VKRPKGPQLKLPPVKAPRFASDLYYDLRDRRLLPLVALIAVAIVATPFLLRQQPETELPPAASAAIEALKEQGEVREASLVVVESKPGLRDYRERLRRRTPLDPFRKEGRPSLKGAKLGNGKGGGSGSGGETTSTSTTVKKTTTADSTKTTVTETTTTTDEKNGSKGGSGTGKSKGGSGNLPSYTIDVEIAVAGDGGVSAQPIERSNVQPLTPLPGKKKPVVTYLGKGTSAGRALFSVSNDVSAVYGEARCVSGTDTCEVLELEPDFPVTFVYGSGQDRYKITLKKIDRA